MQSLRRSRQYEIDRLLARLRSFKRALHPVTFALVTVAQCRCVAALREFGRAPSEDELGNALLAGARLVVNKWGHRLPRGVDPEEVTSYLSLAALARARKWRGGGPKKLADYCYLAAYYAFIELMREYQSGKHQDALDLPQTVSLQAIVKDGCDIGRDDERDGDDGE